MGEWWTYSPADVLLFTPETYYRLLARYNQAVWPLQAAALAAGGGVLWRILRTRPYSGRTAWSILAGAWLWVAWAFHLKRYADIHPAGPVFAGVFTLEGLLLIWAGVVRNRLRFSNASGQGEALVGLFLFGFALAAPPIFAAVRGRPWSAECFGIAPDPTAVATIGLLLAAGSKPSWGLWIVPFLWCGVTGATLWAMGSPAALVAPLTAVLAVGLGIRKHRRGPPRAAP